MGLGGSVLESTEAQTNKKQISDNKQLFHFCHARTHTHAHTHTHTRARTHKKPFPSFKTTFPRDGNNKNKISHSIQSLSLFFSFSLLSNDKLTDEAFDTLGFTQPDKDGLYKATIAIVYLGNAKWKQKVRARGLLLLLVLLLL